MKPLNDIKKNKWVASSRNLLLCKIKPIQGFVTFMSEE